MIDPQENSARISPEGIRRNMLGLTRDSEFRRFQRQLAHQPELVSEAASSIEPDPFFAKLKRLQAATPSRKSQMTEHASDSLPAGTELESDEEVERVRQELRRQSRFKASEQQPAPSSRVEQPFRPTVRPPRPILIMCDDGEATGEVFRLRSERFIIGRTEGDLQLPDDEQISSRHVALTRQQFLGKTRWAITDLQSRNGLFVRVGKSPLVHQAEFLIGSGRYRLEIAQQAVAETAAFEDLERGIVSGTRAFMDSASVGHTLLSEVLAGGIGTRLVLNGDQYWIGSAPDCEVRRAEDPFVRGKHACLTRSPKGTWIIQGNHSLNGIWVRMPQVILEQGKKCEFQIGEQRFRLRFGVPLTHN